MQLAIMTRCGLPASVGDRTPNTRNLISCPDSHFVPDGAGDPGPDGGGRRGPGARPPRPWTRPRRKSRRAAARTGPHGQAEDRRRDRQASGARTSSRTSTPRKYYFVKADVDEFMAQATTLDDKIKEGNLDFATARLRPLPRSGPTSGSRPSWSCSSRSPTSPSTSRSSTTPTSSTTRPTPTEANERWRKRIKLDAAPAQGSTRPRTTRRSRS